MGGEGLKLDQESPNEAEVERADVPWQPIQSSPKDGLPLWLKGEDGKIIEGYWRRTRQFRKGMWQEIFFWAVYGQNPQAVPFNPTHWTRSAVNAG